MSAELAQTQVHKRAQKGCRRAQKGAKERFRVKSANNKVENNQFWELPAYVPASQTSQDFRRSVVFSREFRDRSRTTLTTHTRRFLKGWFPKGWFWRMYPCTDIWFFKLFGFSTFWQFGAVSLPKGGRPRPRVLPELRFAAHWGSAVVGCGHSLECRGGRGVRTPP